MSLPPASAALPARLDACFSDDRVRSLAELSRRIFEVPSLRTSGEISAFAYWLRAGHLSRLEAHYRGRLEGDGWVCVPVGRVFHVAPSAVDTMFAYSWALAYLCGNASVVRLSERQRGRADELLDVIGAWMAVDGRRAESSLFVRYGHDRETTSRLSAWCTHRVLWGGDEAVRSVSASPLPPHASERVHGTRFSFCVLGAQAVVALDANGIEALARAVHNDVFGFDQQACSSPRVVFWVGDEATIAPAMHRLHEALRAHLLTRGQAVAPASALQRVGFAFLHGATADVRIERVDPALSVAHLSDVGSVRRDACGGGYLQYLKVRSVEDIPPFVIASDQTATHFGLSADAVRTLAIEGGARGLDRVVPVGQALSFDALWDGYDLLSDMVKRVRVEP